MTAPRVASILYRVPRGSLASVSEFYSTALGLRTVTRAGATSLNEARLSGGAGCEIVFREDADTVAATGPATLAWPYVTLGVSNLRTAARHAERLGGAVLTDSSTHSPLAVFVDPCGRALHVLHAFRRAPVVSVTLGVRNVAGMASLLCTALGFGVVPSNTIQGVTTQALSSTASVPLALGSGPLHSATSIVLEDSCSRVASDSTECHARNTDTAAVLALDVADVVVARGVCTLNGLHTSSLKGKAFVTLLDDSAIQVRQIQLT